MKKVLVMVVLAFITTALGQPTPQTQPGQQPGTPTNQKVIKDPAE